MVDEQLDQMTGLQRAVESIRYFLLSIEFWISSEGRIREWLRRNVLLAVWLLIPAIFVMPIIGLILWQLTSWFSISKVILFLLVLAGIRMLKR